MPPPSHRPYADPSEYDDSTSPVGRRVAPPPLFARARPAAPPPAPVQPPPLYARPHERAAYAQQSHHAPLASPYARYGDLSAPPPANSLVPVAMPSDRYAGSAGATGPNPVQVAVIRHKASLKMGVMIALTGALMGGVLGLGVDARRQQARAAAAEPPDPMLQTSESPALPASAAEPPVADPAPVALAPAVPEAAAPVPPAPVVLPPSPPVAVTSVRASGHIGRPPPPKHVTAVLAASPPPVRAAPPRRPTKGELAKKDDSKVETPSDVRKVLEDAIKDTTNTL